MIVVNVAPSNCWDFELTVARILLARKSVTEILLKTFTQLIWNIFTLSAIT